MVAAIFDEAKWTYELHGRSEPSPARQELCRRRDRGRRACRVPGRHSCLGMELVMGVTAYELKPGGSWTEVKPECAALPGG